MHEIKLRNQAGKTFYDKLTYIYLEMPNFRKTEAELETRLDKWLYFIKNLEDFQHIPQIFKNEVVFTEAFKKAELSKLHHTELVGYENSLKVYRDLKGVIDSAYDNGKARGIEKGEARGIVKVAKVLKDSGAAIELIIKTTGLTAQEIERQ